MNRIPEAADETLTPARRAAALAAVVALHGALAWALLQAAPMREAVTEVSPRIIELIALAAPAKPAERPPEVAPPRHETAPPTIVTARARATEPPVAAVRTPTQPPEPDSASEPQPQPQPLPAARPVSEVAAAAAVPSPASAPMPTSASAPLPTPPAPRDIPASAIAYLEAPAPTYPRSSRRAGEAGLVVVRVFVDADGVPRQLVAQQSSGFARLDEAALDAVRRARFRPYLEDGRPVAGWARIPIPFELER